MKKLAAAMVMVGGFGLAGCAVDSGAGGMDMADVDSKDQAMGEWDYCKNDNGGTKNLRASLATAMAKEMGRINPLLDLKIGTIPVYWGNMEAIVVSSDGLSRCQSRGKGDCPNVQAILALQDPGINGSPATNWQPLVKNSVVDAASFASKLVSGYRDQIAKEQQDPHYGGLRYDVNLSVAGQQDYWFACGTHIKYNAVSESGATLSQTELDKLKYRLKFFGYNYDNLYDFYSDATNAFIAFVARTDSTVELDPDMYLTGDSTSTAGVCTDACIVYSSSMLGSCCTCNGTQGTYQTLKRGTYTCK